jgi:iron complex outermembrane recepter protein
VPGALCLCLAPVLAAALLSLALASANRARAEVWPVPGGGASAPPDLTVLDIEDLLRLRVTSPGKKPARLIDVPAATTILRSDDLRRQGITTLPEALRNVPGFHVARQSPSNWVISSRGFSSGNSNKLLVLIDGRSVYSKLNSGVFWDVQDTLLEDVDRIEVIRGPGGALYGTNAVNGVVNVITKDAAQTEGLHAGLAGGVESSAQGEARYGFALGESGAARVFAKYSAFDDAVRAQGHRAAEDGFSMLRGGFRSDGERGDRDAYTFQGDVYRGQPRFEATLPRLAAPFAELVRERGDLAGGNLLARWTRELGDRSSLQLQAYYDYTSREDGLFSQDESTGDLELQHRFQPRAGHDVVWGIGYRITRSDFDGDFALDFSPNARTDDILNVFVQDEIRLGERVALTLGTKFEYGDLDGLQVMPNARLAWHVREEALAWLAVSRAVRAPALVDVDSRFNLATLPSQPPIVVSAFGKDDFESEDVFAAEAGYRAQASERLSVDVAMFFNLYEHLRSIEPGTPFVETAPLRLILPAFLENELRGRSYGAELAANLQATPDWRLTLSYSHLYLNLRPTTSSRADDAEIDERRTPRDQVSLRSSHDLPRDLSLDLTGRLLGRTPSLGVDAYAELDARIAWSDPRSGIEVALVGQNLLHHDHEEAVADTGFRPPSAIERAFFVQFTRRLP